QGTCVGPVCGDRSPFCSSLGTRRGPVVACSPCPVAIDVSGAVDPAQDVCFQGICVGPICGDSAFCLAQDGDLRLCCADGSCIDLASDPDNCGGCGVSCHGQACVGGTCAGARCGFSNQGTFC